MARVMFGAGIAWWLHGKSVMAILVIGMGTRNTTWRPASYIRKILSQKIANSGRLRMRAATYGI
jgi:hypothetical protein